MATTLSSEKRSKCPTTTRQWHDTDRVTQRQTRSTDRNAHSTNKQTDVAGNWARNSGINIGTDPTDKTARANKIDTPVNDTIGHRQQDPDPNLSNVGHDGRDLYDPDDYDT